jgi:hypothetical protein
MTIEEAQASEGRSRSWRPGRRTAVAAWFALVISVAGATAATAEVVGTAAITPSPSPIAVATATPTPTASPTASPTAVPTPVPTPPPPQYVAATTSGVLVPIAQASLATRKPIAVMIDDQIRARPQAGLSEADVVYQAPAEGGIPRYMAIFQTKDPALIGPIRSARVYFVVWAEEWRAMYVHVGGATNAQNYLYANNGKYVWNVDEIRYGVRSGYFDRVPWRQSPHNVYTSGARLQTLCQKIGATKPSTQAFWKFTGPAPLADRPYGGRIVVPYLANRITYSYDRVTNTYVRGVTGAAIQVDYGNKDPVTPSTVVVLYQAVGYMPRNPNTTDAQKGRLEIGYNGKGRAMVFENGRAISAVWTKSGDYAPTILTYAAGEHAGEQIPFVRGQVFVQVVATTLAVTWTVGTTPGDAL